MTDFKPKILVFAGSSREHSFNKKLAKVAQQELDKAAAQTTYIDLRDYPMPLFDQDLESSQGMPSTASQVRELMMKADGFFISSPEYNSSISPLLKNTLDWASRAKTADDPALIAYKDKVAAIVSASPGALGGLRGLVTLRSILENSGVLVLPSQLALAQAHEAFSKDGQLLDTKKQAIIGKIAKDLVETLKKLKGNY